jgi:dienelactone hydrolase
MRFRAGPRLIGALVAPLALLVALALTPTLAFAQSDDPEPGTPEWHQRDLENVDRMTTRIRDQLTHPEYHSRIAVDGLPIGFGNLADQLDRPDRPMISLSQLVPGARGADIYRWRWQRQGRGIQVPFEYENRYGARIQGELWAPRSPFVDPVTGDTDAGPYPGVVITTGSVQGYKELYWWAAQGLAEAGYVVMTYDVQGQGKSDTFGHDEDTGFIRCAPGDCPGFPFQQAANFIEGTEDALDWFLSDENPLRGKIDERRLGLAGHSLGAGAVTEVGNRDQRVDAVVGWDNVNLAPDTEPRVPTMGQNAEAGFWPQAFPDRPDPDDRNATFRRFREAGVAAMQVALRGSTHLEWTYIPYVLAASNDGERVAMHYTLAWFDRWLKGESHGRTGREGRPADVRRQAEHARERLTAGAFDSSADASAIGTGRWDPVEGNVPYRIEGIPIEDRLSFYFRSSYAFDGIDCEDMLTGC